MNHDVFDTTYGETDNNHSDYDSDSGSMSVSLNARHHVYVRSAMSCTTFVHSNNNFARSTFMLNFGTRSIKSAQHLLDLKI